jgi:hypothetical protein
MKTVVTENIARMVVAPILDAREGRVVTDGPEEGVDRLGARSDEDGYVVRRANGRRRDQRELITEAARVLDDADDGPALATEGKRGADPDVQKLGYPVCHRDLAGADGVTAPPEGEQVGGVGAIGILCPIVDLLDASGDSFCPVADHVDRLER